MMSFQIGSRRNMKKKEGYGEDFMKDLLLPSVDDDDDDDDDDGDEYELTDYSARHDCNGAGNYLGWCILTDGHGGNHQCGRCADSF
jgi:hypothetical protein